MVKQHLKAIAAPHTWNVDRKKEVFITRPNAGAHTLEAGMSLSTVMRKLIKIAKSSKEVKLVLRTKQVLVDGTKRNESKLSVGLMDVISIPELKESYRMLLDRKGRLTAVKIDEAEAKMKLSRIKSKTKLKGNMIQLNMIDGRNIILKKDAYKTGDVLEISLPDQKIKNHLPFEKKMRVLMIGGAHSGDHGTIKEITENKIKYTSRSGETYETLRKYAFIIGKEKPIIRLQNE
ncbi:MAG: 30S ribosomal protein S4e [Candidatus Nanoarchaeia archaeon]